MFEGVNLTLMKANEARSKTDYVRHEKKKKWLMKAQADIINAIQCAIDAGETSTKTVWYCDKDIPMNVLVTWLKDSDYDVFSHQDDAGHYFLQITW